MYLSANLVARGSGLPPAEPRPAFVLRRPASPRQVPVAGVEPDGIAECRVPVAENAPLALAVDEAALPARDVTWDRSYDFKNIFAKKIGAKISVFDSKQS
jgi:hypothetical protein